MGYAWLIRQSDLGATDSQSGRPTGLIGYSYNGVTSISRQRSRPSEAVKRGGHPSCCVSLHPVFAPPQCCRGMWLGRGSPAIGCGTVNLRNHQHRDVPQLGGCARPCEPTACCAPGGPSRLLLIICPSATGPLEVDLAVSYYRWLTKTGQATLRDIPQVPAPKQGIG